MRSRTFFQSVVACLLILVSSSAWALNMPEAVRRRLEAKGKHHLIWSWAEIPEVSPHDFTIAFLASQPRVLGNGFGGIAYLSADETKIFKISHGVFLNDRQMHTAWGFYRSLPSTLALNIPQHSNVKVIENAANRRSSGRELLGTLMWTEFDETAQALFPTMATDDGMAYSRSMLKGVTFKSVLKAENDPANHALDDRRYDTTKLWQEFIKLQDKAETMLLELGVTVDLLNPDNLIVSGPLDHPKIDLIDHEFLGPCQQTKDYYGSSGITVPPSFLGSGFKTLMLPVMPDQLLVNRNWDLTFVQAIKYIQLRYGIDDTEAGEEAAVRYLSMVPRWDFDVPVKPNQYENIDQAHAIIAANCQSVLGDHAN